ncbi:MAG: adenylate/guanylate cyclase domain-containing protein, partial [Actinomycetia bacterium]|nr:adenylate/guanylate cyclase domain-containing protein [Actinomycetes bacterium]
LNIDLEKEKEKLENQKNAIQRFVPEEFLDLLDKDSITKISPEDHRLLDMSIGFYCIPALSRILREVSELEVINFFNDYFKRSIPIVYKNHGFLDKLMGDTVLVLFPKIQEAAGLSSADNALKSCIGILELIVKINKYRKRKNLEPVNCVMGLNTGPLILGAVGSRERISTTAIGNTVNIAARLTSLTSYYDNNIIISDFTYKKLKEVGKYSIREIDSIFVKGKNDPVVIYEVFDSDPENIKQMKNLTKADLMLGLIHYKMRNFTDAINFFKSASALFPDDPVTNIYITRCENYIKNPPPEDWKGAVRLLRK